LQRLIHSEVDPDEHTTEIPIAKQRSNERDGSALTGCRLFEAVSLPLSGLKLQNQPLFFQSDSNASAPLLHSPKLDTHDIIETEANSSATAGLALFAEWNYLEKLNRMVQHFAAGAPS
jgi:hypothetical protein